MSAAYPPPHHVLRDLGVSGMRHPDRADFRVPFRPGLADASGGIRLGVVATLIDIAGAGMALAAVRPDWIATADLTCHLTGAVDGDVDVSCRPIRAGSSTVVVEATVRRRPGSPGGSGPDGVLPHPRVGHPGRHDRRRRLDDARAVLDRRGTPIDDPILDRCGVVAMAPGTLSLEKVPYVENSFGTVNGGVVALVAEASAVSSAGGGRAVGLQVHYLEQVGAGPMVAEAAALRPGAPALFEVRLRDAAEGRLTAIADVTVA